MNIQQKLHQNINNCQVFKIRLLTLFTAIKSTYTGGKSSNTLQLFNKSRDVFDPAVNADVYHKTDLES